MDKEASAPDLKNNEAKPDPPRPIASRAIGIDVLELNATNAGEIADLRKVENMLRTFAAMEMGSD